MIGPAVALVAYASRDNKRTYFARRQITPTDLLLNNKYALVGLVQGVWYGGLANTCIWRTPNLFNFVGSARLESIQFLCNANDMTVLRASITAS